MDWSRGVLAQIKSNLSLPGLGLGGVSVCLPGLLGSCPNSLSRTNNHLTADLTSKQKKKKDKVLMISCSSIIIIATLNIYPNLLHFHFPTRGIPLSETSDFTLHLLPITSRDSDPPPSPTVLGHSSSTFLYSFSAAHPQSTPPWAP